MACAKGKNTMIEYTGPALLDQSKLLELGKKYIHNPIPNSTFSDTSEWNIATAFLALILECDKQNVDLEIAFIRLIEGRL